MDWAAWAIEGIAREAMLFAAAGFLIGGIDDLVVDACYIFFTIWRRRHGAAAMTVDGLPPPAANGGIAIFVPAWDEVAVIGAMLTATLARFEHDDYRVYVGCYPNDRPTIDAVSAVAERDSRVRLVIGVADGPTTKADCLNVMWHALGRDELASGWAAKAIVLHDAEDVVHPAELRVFDSLIERYSVVQLPVLPLVKRGSRLVSGHYAGEFSEAHAKELMVRTALGAGLPLAGVGCAIARHSLARLAEARGGNPFDNASLTEDYELGLGIAEAGGTGLLARLLARDGEIVAVRAYFPSTFASAIRQKARWMTGIALAGWDRTGWAQPLAIGDHWMRMRDRRAPLAVLVLAAAYVALVTWGLSNAFQLYAARPPAVLPPLLRGILTLNLALLGWRLLMRTAFTGHAYGWREALWSAPRLVVGNYIALLAARRAMFSYVRLLRGSPPVWDKTAHEFPLELGGANTR